MPSTSPGARALAALLLIGLSQAAASPTPDTGWSPAREALLYRFAPVLLQEAHADPGKRRRDVPLRADFDGNQRGNDNEESLRSGLHPLHPHAYAAWVESRTHLFLTYSFFHALDWSPLPSFVPWAWHENDMESVQVVVRKSDSAVILVAAQSHLWTSFAAPVGSPCKGDKLAKSPAVLASGTSGGRHPVILSEWGGHGLSPWKGSALPDTTAHLHFGPRADVTESFTPDRWSYGYRLVSTLHHFWRPHLDGSGVGDGRLMDKTFDYTGERMTVKGIPRHFDSDRWSAPGKRDAGILPFAFSTRLNSDDLGALFFDPAFGYSRLFTCGDEWSLDYLDHPYRSP